MSYSKLVLVFLPALLCSSVAFGQGARNQRTQISSMHRGRRSALPR